jgi:hypothetical protein
MTDHVVRLYALALAMVVFFVTWAAVAARPWAAEAGAQDPRLAALAAREERLAQKRERVQQRLERRFARYRVRLKARRRQIAALNATPPPASASAQATPSVQVVSLPPVTQTRSS